MTPEPRDLTERRVEMICDAFGKGFDQAHRQVRYRGMYADAKCQQAYEYGRQVGKGQVGSTTALLERAAGWIAANRPYLEPGCWIGVQATVELDALLHELRARAG